MATGTLIRTRVCPGFQFLPLAARATVAQHWPLVHTKPADREKALAGIHALGSAYRPPAGVGPADAAVVRRAVSHGVLNGTHWALFFAASVLFLGTVVSLLIPNELIPEKETPLEELPEAIDPLAVDAGVAAVEL